MTIELDTPLHKAYVLRLIKDVDVLELPAKQQVKLLEAMCECEDKRITAHLPKLLKHIDDPKLIMRVGEDFLRSDDSRLALVQAIPDFERVARNAKSDAAEDIKEMLGRAYIEDPVMEHGTVLDAVLSEDNDFATRSISEEDFIFHLGAAVSGSEVARKRIFLLVHGTG